MFLVKRTIQSCFQTVVKKLQHATLKCQSNEEKNYLILFLRTSRDCNKAIRVLEAFSEEVIIKLG